MVDEIHPRAPRQCTQPPAHHHEARNQERKHLEQAAGGPVTDRDFEARMRVWREVERLAGVQEHRQRQRIDEAIAQDAPPITNMPTKRREI